MRLSISQMASPRSFYERITFILPCLGMVAISCLLVAWFWGLFIAPPDYQQGDAVRLLYLHVPTAFLSMALYAALGILAGIFLVWRIKLAACFFIPLASVGAAMAGLALMSGSFWGRPMWGTWWIWDARLTSELVLFFLYVTLLALRQAVPHYESGDRLFALLALVGLVDLPIIHYAVYWWNTLHQGATLTVFAAPKMPLSMLWPLLLSLVGLGLITLFFVLQRVKQEILMRECRQQWVKTLYQAGKI